MNPRLKAAHDRLQALITRGAELKAMDAHDKDQETEYDGIPEQIEQAKAAIAREQKASSSLEQANTFLNEPAMRALSTVTADPEKIMADLKKKSIRGRATFFSQIEGYDRQAANGRAYALGRYLFATQGHGPSKAWCAENGIPLRTMQASGGMSEGDAEAGAALVPPEFETDLIVLRELFGIFRVNARMTPMASETKTRPRRKGGVTAYWVGSGQAATESKATYNQVMLTAKKLMVNTRYESELSEDAFLDIGDTLAGEIAYAFASAEDDAGFNGDGTSTYGGIVGVRAALAAIFGVAAGAGQVLGAGNAWSELTLANFQAVKGALPLFAETPNTAWYCHKAFFEDVIVPIVLAAGGVTAAEVVAGIRRQFLGYPVHICQKMPSSEANSQIPIFFGDLSLAAMFGDRRATTIAVSDQFHFDTDELAIRGTERVDINVHDVGVSGTAGPVVGLVTAAS